MIRVLVVEDEPAVAAAHRTFVDQLDGFEVAGVVHTGHDALAFLNETSVDLVLLDFYLPDTTGLAVCQEIRRSGISVDVMAVTSARDLEVVRNAVSLGVVLYVLKPFTAALLAEKLVRYAEYHRAVSDHVHPAGQQDVDTLLATLRGSSAEGLPKGVSAETWQRVVELLRCTDGDISAADAADQLAIARVTARRYLEHLTERGLAQRSLRYGGAGRPEQLYRLARR